MSGLRLWVVLAVLSGLALPAAARDFVVTMHGRLLSMELAGHIVSVPGPLWGTGDQPVETEQSQIVYRQLAPGIESVLFLPVSQSMASWTHVMGVQAVERDGYKAANQLRSMIDPVAKSCVSSQTLVAEINPVVAGGRSALLVVCGRYRLQQGPGPQSCAAGILIGVAVESSKGAMKVYQQWCSGAFDAANRAAWPVGEAELQRRAAELQQGTSFVPGGLLSPSGVPAFLGGWWK